jgi:hypothetical protein
MDEVPDHAVNRNNDDDNTRSNKNEAREEGKVRYDAKMVGRGR